MVMSEKEGTPPASRGGVHGEWLTLLEDLLGGAVHTTNNATTALSVLLALGDMDGEPLDQVMLTREFGRVQEMAAVVGTLSGRSSRSEALELRPVLDMAVDFHSLHQRHRGIACVVEQAHSLLPVRVPRSELLRLLLLMIDAAKRSCAQGASVVIRLSGDPVQLDVQVACSIEPGDDMRVFAESCGGVVRLAEGALRLELPTLLAQRQRERAS